jgi:hypothetical protein
MTPQIIKNKYLQASFAFVVVIILTLLIMFLTLKFMRYRANKGANYSQEMYTAGPRDLIT